MAWNYIYITLLSLLLISCGGGGEDTIQPPAFDTTPPSVSQVYPVDGDFGIDRNVIVSATFNEEILRSSVGPSSMSISSGGQSLEATVDLGNLSKSVRISPSEKLNLLQEYEVNLSSGVADLSGNPLKLSNNWSFTVRDGRWSTPTRQSADDSGQILMSDVGIDGSGNYHIVWSELQGNTIKIMANILEREGNWGAPVEVSSHVDSTFDPTFKSGDEYRPIIAVSKSGIVILTWQQRDAGVYNIWGNYYLPSTGWHVNKQVSDGSGNSFNPRVATNGNYATAVWYQTGSDSYGVVASLFTVNSEWLGSTVLDRTAYTAIDPSVAMDSAGNSQIVWTEYNPTADTLNILARSHSVLRGWDDAPKSVERHSSSAILPQVAMGSEGNAVATWVELGADGFNIRACFYGAESWFSSGTAVIASNLDDTGVQPQPKISIDENNNAVIVWIQEDESIENVWSSSLKWDDRYSIEDSWTSPVRIDNVTGLDSKQHSLSLDSRGNGLAVWQQFFGSQSYVISARYVGGEGWKPAESIYINDLGNTASLSLHAAPHGDAIAGWVRYDGGLGEVQQARFE